MSDAMGLLKQAVIERAEVCIQAVWAAFDMWHTEAPSQQFVEDLALLLMHSKDETFLDEVWAVLSRMQGLCLYEAQQQLRIEQHGKDYDGVPSVWARIEAEPQIMQKWETEVHLEPGLGVVKA